MPYWLAVLLMVVGATAVLVILYWRWRNPAARASRLVIPFHLLLRPQVDPTTERARRAALFVGLLVAGAGDAAVVVAVALGALTPWALLLMLPSAWFLRRIRRPESRF
jgi:hypothetical protein